MPAGGFLEKPSVLEHTPWWGPIHVAIAAGFVLCVLGSLLMLCAGGRVLEPWPAALCWALTRLGAPATDPLLFDAFNRLLVGYGWLGNPLFLVGLTGIAYLEVRTPTGRLPRWLAWVGLATAVLSWGRGIGSATGLYFLEPLIFANVPAFLWLGLYGLKLAAWASEQSAAGRPE